MKLCLFSVGYAGLWGQEKLDLLEFIPRARRLGYDAVMLMGKRPHLAPLDHDAERVADLRAALTDANVECAVLGAYTDLSARGAAEVPALEMQIAYVEALAGLAGQLGASVVRVFTAYETDTPFLQQWDRVAVALRECCDRAAAHGVVLAVQNHHDVALDPDGLLELLGDIDRPNCKLGFDAWSVALRALQERDRPLGETLYETARRMAPYTVCTTNADYIRLQRFAYQPGLVNYARREPDAVRAVAFGDGCIDYAAFFQGLRDGGFEGIATYEMCSPLRGGGGLANLDRCSERYVTWMRERGFAHPSGDAAPAP